MRRPTPSPSRPDTTESINTAAPYPRILAISSSKPKAFIPVAVVSLHWILRIATAFQQNTLDWAAGLDFTLPADTRFNAQVFQRQFFSYDQNNVSDKRENGYSLLLNKKFFTDWEGQALFISSLNRSDWLFRPR
jgi:hypothetical protein